MPDDNMPGGETFVRQMQYGKGYYRQKLGVDVTSGWLIDTFGHHAQMPQLLAKGGFKTFWFVRGVPRQNFPAEFFWEGIDGTRIASFYLPHSYALTYGSPHDAKAFRTWAIKRYELLTPNAHGPDRVGLAGPDVAAPEDHLMARIDEFNRDPQAPFTMRMAGPADFEKAVAGRIDLSVWKGELNPIFQGIYSSRIELKEWMRVMEERLLTAEKLSVLAALLGSPADLDGIWAGWEPVLFNQTHDLASGVMTDHVYEDTIRSYKFARRTTEAIIDAKWDVLTSKIDTRRPSAPLVVFNTLGWPRSDIAVANVGFGEGGAAGIVLTDSNGAHVPFQIVESARYTDGGFKTARVAFIADDVPALGYSTYHVRAAAIGDAITKLDRTFGPAAGKAGTRVEIENPHYRVALDRATGAIVSLRVKDGDRELFSGPGNVVGACKTGAISGS